MAQVFAVLKTTCYSCVEENYFFSRVQVVGRIERQAGHCKSS